MWAWARTRITGRPEPTEGQLEQERETAVSLGLMAQAAAAGAAMTDEQAIFLSASKTGMRDRISNLLRIPNRSLAQERELTMITRELARLEGRESPDPAPSGIRPLMGAGGGIMAAITPFLPIALILMLFASITGWGGSILNGIRAHNATERAERLEDRLETEHRDRVIAETEAHNATAALEIARQQSAAYATNLEAERRATARARRREQERNRAIQAVIVSDAPPAWSLRDVGEDEAGARGGDEPPAGDSGGLPR